MKGEYLCVGEELGQHKHCAMYCLAQCEYCAWDEQTGRLVAPSPAPQPSQSQGQDPSLSDDPLGLHFAVTGECPDGAC